MIFKPQVFSRREDEKRVSIGDYYVAYYVQREELISIIKKEMLKTLEQFRGNEHIKISTRQLLNHDPIEADSTMLEIRIEIKPERKIDYIRK